MVSPIILAALTIIIWSTVGIFTKAVNLPGNSLIYLVTVFSALVTFQLAACYKSRSIFFPRINELFSKKALFSSLGFGFYWLCIGQSIAQSNNASVPMALQCSWPLFNSIFISLFFLPLEEKVKLNLISRSSIGLAIGFTGILILFLGDNSIELSPNISSAFFALCSGASFGLYSAYSSTVAEKNHLNFLILSSVTGIIVLTPWVLIDSSAAIDLSLSHLLLAIIFGVIADGLGTFLWTKANRLITEKKQKISTITSLTLTLPFLTAFFLYLVFGETQIFQSSYILGLSLLLIGIYLCKGKRKVKLVISNSI